MSFVFWVASYGLPISDVTKKRGRKNPVILPTMEELIAVIVETILSSFGNHIADSLTGWL